MFNEDRYYLNYQARVERWDDEYEDDESGFDNENIDMQVDDMIMERLREND